MTDISHNPPSTAARRCAWLAPVVARTLALASPEAPLSARAILERIDLGSRRGISAALRDLERAQRARSIMVDRGTYQERLYWPV